jgi:hypothetical protein
MPIPPDALELENRHIGSNGEPTLGEAFNLLRTEWQKGDRDRELCLHLLFLGWYGSAEPQYLTGFQDSDVGDLQRIFTEVFEYIQPDIQNDAEMLYVVGLGAHLFGYLLPGGETIWDRRSEEYRRRYREVCPNGLDPVIFLDRGYYGHYYYGQARVEGGY